MTLFVDYLKRHHLALICLVLILTGGTAYAAQTHLPKGSVASKQIKNSSITGKDVKDGSLAGGDIVDGGLTSGDVADGSLTGADVGDGSIAEADLQASARGAKVIRYDLGAFDFTSTFLQRQLPGTWDAATVAGSTWSLIVHSDSTDRDYVLPGLGYGGTTNYRISISPTGKVYVDKAGAGEAYSNIRLIRVISTSVQVVPSASRVARPAAPNSDR